MKKLSYLAPDASWEHLFPVFRFKLQAVLAETERETGRKWRLAEGYRSQERQSWLYAAGRTRPGPVVTWMVHPTNHGAGLGADCYPETGIDDAEPYEVYRKLYLAAGLVNPAWEKSDKGHVQLTNEVLRQEALAWIARGFPEEDGVRVSVNGIVVPTVEAFLQSGHAWVQLRPLLGLLHLVLDGPVPAPGPSGNTVALVGDPPGTASSLAPGGEPVRASAPFAVRNGSGYVPVTALRPWAEVVWEASTRLVSFVRR